MGTSDRHIPPKELKWVIGANFFNIMDAFVTLLFLSYGLQEMNPIMRFLLENHEVTFVLVKILVLLLISYRWVRSKKWWAFRLTSVVFCGIVIWNIVQLCIHLKG